MELSWSYQLLLLAAPKACDYGRNTCRWATEVTTNESEEYCWLAYDLLIKYMKVILHQGPHTAHFLKWARSVKVENMCPHFPNLSSWRIWSLCRPNSGLYVWHPYIRVLPGQPEVWLSVDGKLAASSKSLPVCLFQSQSQIDLCLLLGSNWESFTCLNM